VSKYDPLHAFLEEQSADELTLTLVQLDAIVKLPAAAKRYAFWWSNEDVKTTVHVQSKAWQEAGYLAEPNLRGKRVTFRRRPELRGEQSSDD
jgi:hypothetical protein